MSGRIAKRCLVAAAAGLFMFGCGSRECGAGTVEMDGECVAAPVVMCAEGTMEVDGTCVTEVTECGPGTTLNADTGECDPDIAECAPGTVAMGSECVPDGSMICVDGTTYDADTGTCVITDAACGDGAIFLDGECVPADAALTPDVDSVEVDDPEFDGTPVSFTVPAEGAEVTLGGCIEPVDLDADGSLDPDVDVFEVSVTDATLLRINADGLGGAAAAFAVFPEEDSALEDVGWFRVAINLVGDTSARQVYLPAAGTYTVQVFDSRSVALESLAAGSFGFARAVGTADTCYFVTVETLAIPSPTALSPGERVGMVTENPVFYELTPSARTIYRSDLTDDGPITFMGQTMTVGDAVSVGQGALASPPVDGGTPVLLVVDHIVNLSLDPVQYTLEVSELPEIPVGGMMTFTHDSTDDPGVFVGFEATAGDVVHFSFDSFAQPVEIGVFGPELGNGIAPCGVASGRPEAETTCEAWYVVRQSGSQMVRVWNPGSTDGATYDVRFDIQVHTPVDLPLGTPATVTFTDERAFARVDLTSTPWAAFTTSGFMGAAFTSVDVDVFGPQTLVLSTTDSGGTLEATPLRAVPGVVTGFSHIYGPDNGPDALLQLRDPGGFDGDESLTLEAAAETIVDLTVDPMTPASTTGDTVPAGGSAFYLVRAVAGGTVTFEATGTGGTDPVLHRLDETATQVASDDATGADGVESMDAVAPRGGWLAFEIEAIGGGTVDVSVSQTPPPYTTGPGTTTYTSVCPSEGGAGTVLATFDDGSTFGALDEGLSSPTTFSTFSGFSFFGDPVTGFVSSTNGWITFDTGYGGMAIWDNDPLGTAAAPNDLVAAHWDDLVLDRTCVLDEASRYVIEMVGEDFAGTGRVEMQIILHASGDIEFVYGSNHTLDDEDSTVGLENSDASVIIDPDLSIAPSTSILFTAAP